MAIVSWRTPGTSGNWGDPVNWTGLFGLFYPGELFQLSPFFTDNVTIGDNLGRQRLHRHLQCPEYDHRFP